MNPTSSAQPQRLLDFAVIGAQKSGSTYMLRSLRDHADIFMHREEVPYFETGQYDESRFDEFLARWKNAGPNQRLGVKRPNWLCQPQVPGRIAKHMPACKLIAVLRHPIERAISGYFHYMASGFIPIEDIETGMPALLDRFDVHDPDRATDVLNFGLYGAAIERWLAFFPPQQMHWILFEQLKENPQTTIRQTFAFCGVASEIEISPRQERPMASIYSLNRLRLKRLWIKPNMVCRDGVAHLVEGHRSKLDRWRSICGEGLDRVVWSRVFKSQAPKISPSLRQRLQDFYQQDILKTQDMLGQDLSNWLK